MNSNKLTNIVLTGALITFIIMGILSLKLNYEGIENQNEILKGHDISMELHANERSNSSKTVIGLLLEIRELLKS